MQCPSWPLNCLGPAYLGTASHLGALPYINISRLWIISFVFWLTWELFMDVLGWWMDIYNFPLLTILFCFGPSHKGESIEYPLLRYLTDPTLPHPQRYITIIQLFCQVDLTWLLSLLWQIPHCKGNIAQLPSWLDLIAMFALPNPTLQGQHCPIAKSTSACGLPELASRCPQFFQFLGCPIPDFFSWSAKTSAPKN